MVDKTWAINASTWTAEKRSSPSEEQIRHYLGEESWHRLLRLEDMLRDRYDLRRQLKFPFGNEYGWGFRYAHKNSLLLYAFFRKDSFDCTISINDAGARRIEAIFDQLEPETQSLWANRYPCGAQGGWIHLLNVTDHELPDLITLVAAKKRPLKPGL